MLQITMISYWQAARRLARAGALAVVCGAAAVGAHLIPCLDRLMDRCWTLGTRCKRAQYPEVLAAARSAAAELRPRDCLPSRPC